MSLGGDGPAGDRSPDLVDLLIWLKRWPHEREQRRRRRLGLCYFCGYNVTGTAEQCPECGRRPLYRKGDPPNWPEIILDEPADDRVDLPTTERDA